MLMIRLRSWRFNNNLVVLHCLKIKKPAIHELLYMKRISKNKRWLIILVWMWRGRSNNPGYHNRTNIAFHGYERMAAIDVSALVIPFLGFHGNFAAGSRVCCASAA